MKCLAAAPGNPVAGSGDPAAPSGDPVAASGDPAAASGDPVAARGIWVMGIEQMENKHCSKAELGVVRYIFDLKMSNITFHFQHTQENCHQFSDYRQPLKPTRGSD